MTRSFALVTTLLALALLGPAAAAQDAATTESAAAGGCVAPDLPPGTVTPPQDAPADVAPVAAEDVVPAATAVPAGIPADQATIARVTAAEQNMMNCFNNEEWDASAALFTPDGLLFFFGSPNPYDAAANLVGYPHQEMISVENVEVLPDGRLRDEITYTVGKQLTAGVSYWVDQDGVLLLDDFAELPEPIGAPAGAPVVEVEMVDYAYVLSEFALPAAEAIVLRTSIRTASDSDHVATLASCPSGTTAEKLILGEVDYPAACPDHHGQIYLRPSQPGDHDMILIGLEPGTYFLVCDVVTPAGNAHHKLGMVAQITIE